MSHKETAMMTNAAVKKLIYRLLLIASIAPVMAQINTVVTNGQVIDLGARYEIKTKSSRFNFPDLKGDKIKIEVEYLGKPEEISLLQSGKYMSQVVLKIREVNQCNLVYVARRFEPSEIAILTKENFGQSTHSECQNHGYSIVAKIKLPNIKKGDKFTLETNFKGDSLTVVYNGQQIWHGNIIWPYQGNFGMRTDNAHVIVTLKE
jgi:hypothetical protein